MAWEHASGVGHWQLCPRRGREEHEPLLKSQRPLEIIYCPTCVLSCFSRVQLFATPRTVACQALLSMGFPRQGYWTGLPFPTLRHLPNPGIEPASLMSPALASRFFTTSAIWGLPCGLDGKESIACNVGDLGSISGLGRSPGGGHGSPLQYSCLENPMDRKAWWA